MKNFIHQTALIDSAAKLDTTVSVGAYSVVGPNVCIDSKTKIGPHCVIGGHTFIGKNNIFYRFCSIGGIPQDKKYLNEPTKLKIGDNNTIREYVTINTGTIQSGGVTTLGNSNWLMSYVHVAHDCKVGNNIILANSVQLGGHVIIDDWAIIGGLTGIHQFVRVGSHCMIGGNSSLMRDSIPYLLASGNPCIPISINLEGLKRRGFSKEKMSILRKIYKCIYKKSLKKKEAYHLINLLKNDFPKLNIELEILLEFLKKVGRGIIRP